MATSTEASDDPVAEFCEQAGVAVHRGSLEDVASRVLDAARAHDLDAFVRINGDSPFLTSGWSTGRSRSSAPARRAS